ncbi:MAG: DUF5602 domain-containing protein [Gemmatimonadota bacterium]
MRADTLLNASLVSALALTALVPDALSAQTAVATAANTRGKARAVEARRSPARATVLRFGDSASVGSGRVRSYVTVDAKTGAPTEIGVAFSAAALDSLPSDGAGHHGQHGRVHQWNLALPAGIAAPFRFVEVNWNPMGHEPAGVYQDIPHFDFHFYTIDMKDRDAIVPTAADYIAKANNLPDSLYVPPFTLQLGPPGAKPSDVAVPMMGVHWIDVRSSELQALLGKPEAFKPFTATFIHGSWDGRFHFWEPMITRAHMLAKRSATDPAVRDEIIPLSVPKRYQVPGAYPTAYRITYDAAAAEYRVALTRLVARR